MNVVRLGEIAESLSCDYGDNPVQGAPKFEVVKVSNVSGEGEFHGEFEKRSFDAAKLPGLLVDEGELLVVKSSGSKANILSGKTAICGPDRAGRIVASNFLLRLRIDESAAIPKYIWYVLNSGRSKAFVKTIVGASTYPNLKWSLYSSHPIPLPSLPRQRRIANILDKADALRAKRRAALAQLDALAQSIFLEMFGDPVVNPKEWPLERLGQIGELDRGISKHRPRNAPELLNGPYPFVQTGDVANCNGYIREYKGTYSEVGLRQSKMWPARTLCITIAANIAKTGILTFDACFPDSVVGFTTDEPSTVEFIRYWFSFLQKTLEATAPESAQKNINLRILRNLAVPLPPIELRRHFTRRVEAIEALKSQHRASLEHCDELFASLQQRAFQGDL